MVSDGENDGDLLSKGNLYLCSNMAHTPYSSAFSLYSLSCLSSICATCGLCTVPTLNLFFHIVVVYCLYFPRLCHVKILPCITRTSLIVVQTSSQLYSKRLNLTQKDSPCSLVYHPCYIAHPQLCPDSQDPSYSTQLFDSGLLYHMRVVAVTLRTDQRYLSMQQNQRPNYHLLPGD